MSGDDEHMKKIAKLPRQTKLTFEQRKLIATSLLEPSELARQFDVHVRTIYRYRSRPGA